LSTPDAELLEHLKHCPACARLARADSELREAFAQLAAPDISDGLPWPEQVRQVERQAALKQLGHGKENRIMSALTNQLRKRPKLSYGLAAAAVALVALTVIPFKLDRAVGFEVAVAGVNRDLAFDTERVNNLLDRLGVSGATVDVTGCEQTCNLKIAALKSPMDAEKVRVAFEELSEGAGMVQVQIAIDLRSIDEPVSGSAFKHATTTLVAKITDDESDEVEMREFVAQKLQGFEGNVFFFCDTAADGTKQVQVITSSDAAGGEFQWVDKDGNISEKRMVIIGASDGDFSGCVIQPDQIVDGHLTDEARRALQAQGYTVEEVAGDDGSTSAKLTRMVDGKEEVIEINLALCKPASEAAKESTEADLPEGYSLSQNYPNPFNPTTQFDFSLPKSEQVRIDIFNVNGQKVRTLVDGAYPAGSHTVTWDATSDNGDPVATGVYLYRLTAGEVTQTKKMSFIK